MAKINQTKPNQQNKTQQRRRQKKFLSIAHTHYCVFPFLFSSSSLFGLPISLFLYFFIDVCRHLDFIFLFFLIIFSLYNINFGEGLHFLSLLLACLLAVFFLLTPDFFSFLSFFLLLLACVEEEKKRQNTMRHW